MGPGGHVWTTDTVDTAQPKVKKKHKKQDNKRMGDFDFHEDRSITGKKLQQPRAPFLNSPVTMETSDWISNSLNSFHIYTSYFIHSQSAPIKREKQTDVQSLILSVTRGTPPNVETQPLNEIKVGTAP